MAPRSTKRAQAARETPSDAFTITVDGIPFTVDRSAITSRQRIALRTLTGHTLDWWAQMLVEGDGTGFAGFIALARIQAGEDPRAIDFGALLDGLDGAEIDMTQTEVSASPEASGASS
jgi:hypothetical protein